MTNFDRTTIEDELPKLEGCFTRGVQYHWSIFQPYVMVLSADSEVLDVGCGSLIETRYLAQRGFRVTGIDLDMQRLEDYLHRYNWLGMHVPKLRAVTLEQLAAEEGRRFDAITVFDVIEHLPDLNAGLRALRQLSKPGGLLFISIPNGRSLSEVYGWTLLHTMRLFGREPEVGVPHLQVHTPAGWRKSFLSAGFEICDWQMVIGPAANIWSVLTTAPAWIGLMALQLLHVIDRERRHKLTFAFEARLRRSSLPRLLKVLDDHTRSVTEPFYTWNLVVLRAPAVEGAPAP